MCRHFAYLGSPVTLASGERLFLRNGPLVVRGRSSRRRPSRTCPGVKDRDLAGTATVARRRLPLRRLEREVARRFPEITDPLTEIASGRIPNSSNADR